MPEDQLTFSITREMHGSRLDRALAENLAELGLSREQCKKHILEGRVTLNDTLVLSPKSLLSEGDRVSVAVSRPESELIPEEGGLKVIYSDAALVVVDKPAGLTVHPCPSCPQGTLVHRLIHHFPDLEGGGQRPGIVHRLDKDTSGLLLVARTEKCRLALSEMFARREVDKAYAALVHGVPRPAAGEINAPLARHPTNKTKMAVQPGGREAVTRYRTVYADPDGRFALLDVNILTGRTHQIRVHLAHLGHPLWGDRLYGGKTHLSAPETGPAAKRDKSDLPAPGLLVARRQMLHARRLAFRHPESGEDLNFTLPLPDDFLAALLTLLERPLRLIITGLPGCGKSSFLKALAEKGLPSFSADDSVARLYAPGAAGWDLLHRRFAGRFTPDATLPVDRKGLVAAMQEAQDLRYEVEHLIHPLVEDELAAFWRQHAQVTVLAAEVPLYVEAGWHTRGETAPRPQAVGAAPTLHFKKNLFSQGGKPLPLTSNAHIMIVISCPEELRFARLAARGLSPELIRALDSWQLSEAEKIRAGHLIFHNNGSLQGLREAADELVQGLALLRAGRAKAALDACLAALEN